VIAASAAILTFVFLRYVPSREERAFNNFVPSLGQLQHRFDLYW